MFKKIRNFVFVLIVFCVGFVACFASNAKNITSQEAIDKLIAGNKRFVKLQQEHPDQSFWSRVKGLRGQHPFAVILTCSDSRVSPEIIFDQGLGDLFEVRNAGNVSDDHVVGSIEYAVAHLDTPLVLVLGHQDCGAVKAAIMHDDETEHIKSLVEAIQPAVDKAKTMKGDFYDNSIRENVKLVVESLKQSEPILKKRVESGKVVIMGGYYHIDSGKVEFFD